MRKTKFTLDLDTQSYKYISDIGMSGDELKERLIQIKNTESSNDQKVFEYRMYLNENIFKKDTEYKYTVIFDNYMFI